MSSKEVLNKAFRENRIIPVTVKGDSMEPKYNHGDIVLVDTEYKNPTGGGEFCIDGLGSNVFRADCNGKGICIIPTNKHYDDHTMDFNEFAESVIGRVIGHIQARLITEATSKPITTLKAIAQ